jgi:glycosyltransferase involved in cell wall biosynthesis
MAGKAQMSKLNRPLNVLWLIDHVCYDGSLHGGGRLFMNLLPRFDEKRVKIHPFFLRASDEVKRVFAEAGSPVKTLEIGKFDPLAGLKIAKLCRERSIDAMHLCCYGASTWGRIVGASRNIPTVVQDFDTQIYFPYPAYLRMADRLLAQSTGHAFAASSACRDYMRDVRRIPSNRLDIMYHAIPASLLTAVTAEDRSRARKALGLGDDEFVYLAVTKLGPDRGNETMLAAFAEVRKKVPRSRLVIVYKPTLYHRLPKEYDGLAWARDPAQMRARLDAEIARHGVKDALLLSEQLDNPYEYYKAADVVIAPYENSRFSSVGLIDAMAYGLPFISTNLGEPQELLEHYKCGMSVPPKDVAALAQAMTKVATEPSFLSQLKRNASAGAADLTVDATASRLAGVYERLAGVSAS